MAEINTTELWFLDELIYGIFSHKEKATEPGFSYIWYYPKQKGITKLFRKPKLVRYGRSIRDDSIHFGYAVKKNITGEDGIATGQVCVIYEGNDDSIIKKLIHGDLTLQVQELKQENSSKQRRITHLQQSEEVASSGASAYIKKLQELQRANRGNYSPSYSQDPFVPSRLNKSDDDFLEEEY